MKLISSVAVYLLIGAVLGYGMYLAALGSWWVLAVSVLAYVVWFGKVGCLPKSHH